MRIPRTAMHRATRRGLVMAVALATVACENAGQDRVLSITAIGVANGFVYLDANGTGQFESGETGLAAVRVVLTTRGTADTAASTLTDAQGVFRVANVPVGHYVVGIDTTTIGDSVDVIHIDSSGVAVVPDDSTFVLVTIGYPAITVTQFRALAPGTRAFVNGVALTSTQAFGDSTSSVRDTSGWIRLARPTAFIGTGDSARFVGVRGTRNGQPTIENAREVFLFAFGSSTPPARDTVTNAVARTAGVAGVPFDAALVRVRADTIVDTATVTVAGPDSGNFRFRVFDGSDTLTVELDRRGGAFFGQSLAPYVPGAVFNGQGILVPDGAGAWRLKPRQPSDVAVTLPIMTVAQVRRLVSGRRAQITAVALTATLTYGDTTTSLRDSSGWIRVARPLQFIGTGDTARFVGVSGTRNGSPTFEAVKESVLVAFGAGVPPAKDTVTNATARTAGGGPAFAFDAALVRVLNDTIVDTATVTSGPDSTGFLLTVVNNGDSLAVVLDRRGAAFGALTPPGPYIPGAILDVTGLLVPSGGAVWRLKPRLPADITVQ